MYERMSYWHWHKEVWVPPGRPAPPQAWWCQATGSLLYVIYISICYRWNGNSFKGLYLYGNERWSKAILTWLAGVLIWRIDANFSIIRSISANVKCPDTEHTIFMNHLVLFHVCKQSSMSFWGDGTKFTQDVWIWTLNVTDWLIKCI
jgi:hypothetical protein